MKFNKLFVLSSLILTLGLTSCGGDNTEDLSSSDESISTDEKSFETAPLNLKIACPSGSPAVSLFAHLGEENVEINAAANVQAYMSDTSDKDIVILPTNFGVNAIMNKNVSFKIAATVTFGNFYLLSTGLDENSELNENDKVLAFQQNGVAGKLFNYVYGDKNLDVTYLSDAVDVKNTILSDSSADYEYVLLAQPVVNAILKAKPTYSLFANLQEDYKAKSGGAEITQASIFVKNSADKEKAKEDLAVIKKDVEQLFADTNLIIEQTSSLEAEVISGKLNGTAQAIKGLIDNNNQLGIGYKNAYENKDNIDTFLGSLGMGETSEEIYFHD